MGFICVLLFRLKCDLIEKFVLKFVLVIMFCTLLKGENEKTKKLNLASKLFILSRL